MPRCATNKTLLKHKKPKPDHRISVAQNGHYFCHFAQKPLRPKISPDFSKFSGFSSVFTFSTKNQEKSQKSNFSAGPENSRTFGANSRTFGANSRTFGANSRTFREIPARFGKFPHVSGKFPHVPGKFPHVPFFGRFLPFFAFFRDFSDFAISQSIGGHTLQDCKTPKF